MTKPFTLNIQDKTTGKIVASEEIRSIHVHDKCDLVISHDGELVISKSTFFQIKEAMKHHLTIPVTYYFAGVPMPECEFNGCAGCPDCKGINYDLPEGE